MKSACGVEKINQMQNKVNNLVKETIRARNSKK